MFIYALTVNWVVTDYQWQTVELRIKLYGDIKTIHLVLFNSAKPRFVEWLASLDDSLYFCRVPLFTAYIGLEARHWGRHKGSRRTESNQRREGCPTGAITEAYQSVHPGTWEPVRKDGCNTATPSRADEIIDWCSQRHLRKRTDDGRNKTVCRHSAYGIRRQS